MDFALPGDDHPARAAFRTWLAEHPSPSAKEVAEAGYVAPHWPRPWGLDADPISQLVIDEEMKRAGIRRPINPIGIGWAGPTLMHAGTEEQQSAYLPGILSGEDIWCQLFSEPGAGSDLASLTTRAVRDGDEWVVNGQKVWTTLAHVAKYGILLARTDAEAPKHQGISYFVLPVGSPGVTVRPIVDMTGDHAFNEVFLDEVRIPAGNLVGKMNDGWRLAKVTLGNERVSLSGEGALWGNGPTAADLVDLVRRSPADLRGAAHGDIRDRLVATWAEGEVLRLVRLRTLGALLAGRTPGAEASVRKALADRHGGRVMNLARDLAGPYGLLSDGGPLDGLAGKSGAGTMPGEGGAAWPSSFWAKGFLFSPALTIGGGTSEVQRNIVAERVLGLPHDPAA
ncbi:MAG: acyl-CoA dehydrogenase family protein [Actinomycetota bacterium]|jgi:alkylation response protein AidB-like acyl-CoA dehydrogenase|nr:acyl-CoA dehydrogenase family protein [Actinomycetota bacterium]